MPTDNQDGKIELIGRKAPVCETGVGRSRIKVRHLSQQTRGLILDMFTAIESSEEVATRLGLPMRTVDDVVKLAALPKKPPQPERGAAMQILRRTA